MRIGFDVDGVLANFVKSYQNLTVTLTGRNLFDPQDEFDPPCWNWPEYRGYRKDEMDAVWKNIKSSSTFWLGLKPLPGAFTLKRLLPHVLKRNDVYFATSRPGDDAKWQSEIWLHTHLEMDMPTVLITSEKGMTAAALKLDVYIDDNFDNVLDVAVKSPKTRTYLLNASYNHGLGSLPASVRRIDTVADLFNREDM